MARKKLSGVVTPHTEILGMDDLLRAFDSLPPNMRVIVTRKANMLAHMIKTEAETNIRKNKTIDSGKMLGSMAVKNAEVQQKSPYLIIARLYTRSEYAAKIELGHKIKVGTQYVGVVKPYSFLRKAADKHRKTVVNNMVDALNEALAGFGDKL